MNGEFNRRRALKESRLQNDHNVKRDQAQGHRFRYGTSSDRCGHDRNAIDHANYAQHTIALLQDSLTDKSRVQVWATCIHAVLFSLGCMLKNASRMISPFQYSAKLGFVDYWRMRANNSWSQRGKVFFQIHDFFAKQL
jgi:hypothetical protein